MAKWQEGSTAHKESEEIDAIRQRIHIEEIPIRFWDDGEWIKDPWEEQKPKDEHTFCCLGWVLIREERTEPKPESGEGDYGPEHERYHHRKEERVKGSEIPQEEDDDKEIASYWIDESSQYFS